MHVNRDISVTIVTRGYTTRVQFSAGTGTVLFSTTPIPAMRLTQPPIQRAPGDLSPEVKRPKREADNFQLVLRLEMNGELLPCLMYALMMCLLCTGRTFTLFILEL